MDSGQFQLHPKDPPFWSRSRSLVYSLADQKNGVAIAAATPYLFLPPTQLANEGADTVGELRNGHDHLPQWVSIIRTGRANSDELRDWGALQWSRGGFANSIPSFSRYLSTPPKLSRVCIWRWVQKLGTIIKVPERTTLTSSCACS